MFSFFFGKKKKVELQGHNGKCMFKVITSRQFIHGDCTILHSQDSHLALPVFLIYPPILGSV